ncbi:hypothetical protein TKK_0014806 [Trichogramma kaykai]
MLVNWKDDEKEKYVARCGNQRFIGPPGHHVHNTIVVVTWRCAVFVQDEGIKKETRRRRRVEANLVWTKGQLDVLPWRALLESTCCSSQALGAKYTEAKKKRIFARRVPSKASNSTETAKSRVVTNSIGKKEILAK